MKSLVGHPKVLLPSLLLTGPISGTALRRARAITHIVEQLCTHDNEMLSAIWFHKTFLLAVMLQHRWRPVDVRRDFRCFVTVADTYLSELVLLQIPFFDAVVPGATEKHVTLHGQPLQAVVVRRLKVVGGAYVTHSSLGHVKHLGVGTDTMLRCVALHLKLNSSAGVTTTLT